ncbi:cupin domain-containing protein [Deinococcus pimensis]|uniref:cupin domain-containing protein n=1 Tax=Deinococcus pimensis TaxID=309888 RepID=UPI0004B3891D|nr:cupin domain-containing protein [Deinococcus pimensis]
MHDLPTLSLFGSRPPVGKPIPARPIQRASIVALMALLAGAASAQAPGVTLRAGHANLFTGQPAEINVEQDVLELAPGACTGVHEHGGPGLETVISGTITVDTRGETSRRTVRAGQMYVIPVGVVHNVCNPGRVPAVFTAALLLPRGAAAVTPR